MKFQQMTLAQAAQELPPALFRRYYARAQEFFTANAHLKRDINDVVIVVRFDPDQPRDEDGRWTDGGGGGGGGGGGAAPSSGEGDKLPQAELFPGMFPPIPEPAKPAKISDFHESEVRIDTETRTDPEKGKKFIDRWNEHVKEAPAEFKKDFLGGLPASMSISYDDREDAITIMGKLEDANGARIGEYTRTIDFDDKTAHSDYFVLNSSERSGGIGKQLLASNVATYQKMDIDTVGVHANIDVGGYAWARYGYVPTQGSWRSLSSEIEDKINELSGGGGGYRPESWEELTSDQQDEVFSKYAEATHDEYYESERENWYDSGGALEQAKINLANDYTVSADWANNALDKWRAGRGADAPPVPFGNDVILQTITVDYKSRRADGSDDPDIGFDDGAFPVNSDPATLTEDMRDDIKDTLERAFNSQADKDAEDIDPPDYLADNIRDFQRESFDSMRDRDKYKWAVDNDALPEYGGEGSGEMPDDDADELRSLAQSDDPKALWAIADSEWGKKLLLGTDWNGELNLHDKETMDRFHAYVGKAKAKAAT
jgi:hypothetical protein